MDLSPLVRLLALAGAIALVLLGWWYARQRYAEPRARIAALTALTLFLTFDLIVFGSFTRLTDSGLGCPDWPGCYGHASPVGAGAQIDAAQSAQPTGPVTWSKAWIEMIHRYLAMTVGALIVVLTLLSWGARRRLPLSPWWATTTLAWVIVQGLFGMFTVTWKLHPGIVTLHLLGGMALLALLAVQRARLVDRMEMSPRLLPVAALAVLVAQIALGAWVSSNYAVLACTGFPACNGQWWPTMDFGHGFTLHRDLGRTGAGDFLPFEALVAIHMVHRWFAVLAAALLFALAWRLAAWPESRSMALAVAGLTALQIITGLSNVVLGWPIVAALVHVAGAAALVGLLCSLGARLMPAFPPGVSASGSASGPGGGTDRAARPRW